MRYRSYEEVEDLDTRALFYLLYRGDAQERVWASWALGLRLDGRFATALGHLVRTDPAAGTRRHQTLMLAGFGCTDDLRFVATHDDDARVRGTALGYLTRFCDPDDTPTYDMIVHRMLNEQPATQVAIVDAIREDAPDFVLEALASLTDHEDPILRRTSRRTRARCDPTYVPPAVVKNPFVTTEYPLLVTS